MQASKIITLVRAALDAEGSDYYKDAVDLIPAINSAQSFLVNIISTKLGAKKFAEEYYRDLIKALVFQTSQYSRVDVTPTSPAYKVWTILSVVVKPTLNNTFVPANVLGGASVQTPQYIYVSGGAPCTRMTAEEWALNAENPFASGYTAEPTTLNPEYAYLHHVDYNFSTINPAIANEIEIRPYLSREPVVIYFVKVPSDVVNVTDNIDFPDSFTDVIVKATLREIAYKQGDNTNIYGLAHNEIMTFIQNMI